MRREDEALSGENCVIRRIADQTGPLRSTLSTREENCSIKLGSLAGWLNESFTFWFVFRFHSFAAAFYFPDKFHGKFHSTAPAFFSGWQFSTLSVPLDDVTAKHLPASDPDSSIQYQTKLMAREHAKRFRVSFFRNEIQESVEQLNRNRTSQANET